MLHKLGQLYHQTGQSEEEVEVYSPITEIDPLDAVALRLGKDASARASMSAGRWNAIQPIFSCGLNWANTWSAPNGFAKRFQSCSGPGKTRTPG